MNPLRYKKYLRIFFFDFDIYRSICHLCRLGKLVIFIGGGASPTRTNTNPHKSLLFTNTNTNKCQMVNECATNTCGTHSVHSIHNIHQLMNTSIRSVVKLLGFMTPQIVSITTHRIVCNVVSVTPISYSFVKHCSHLVVVNLHGMNEFLHY